MRHRNSVRRLGRSHSHREAMYSNMVTSFFEEERIVTTKQKGKELQRISEKLITRAKENLRLGSGDEAKKLHNKRMVMRIVKNRDVLRKLFEEIAPRFLSRNGGYTRTYLLGRRAGDAAEMAILELVERKAKPVKAKAVKEEKETAGKEKKKEAKVKKEKPDKADKKEKKEKKKEK